MQRSQNIKISFIEGHLQLYFNDAPYHSDKLLPLLKERIDAGDRIHLVVVKDEKTLLDVLFLKPVYEEIHNFILSYPKTKIYKSFRYFLNEPRI